MGEKYLGMNLKSEPKAPGVFVSFSVLCGIFHVYNVSEVNGILRKQEVGTAKRFHITEKYSSESIPEAFKMWVRSLFSNPPRVCDITITPAAKHELSR